MDGSPAIEHGRTASGRWLRERRLKIALGIALVEGILVIVDVIPNSVAIVVGLGVVAFWFFVGRNLPSDFGRQASWTAALSQVFMALVPLLAFVLTALAVVALVVIAVVALFALLADRR